MRELNPTLQSGGYVPAGNAGTSVHFSSTSFLALIWGVKKPSSALREAARSPTIILNLYPVGIFGSGTSSHFAETALGSGEPGSGLLMRLLRLAQHLSLPPELT
jgi:hypothetical protein